MKYIFSLAFLLFLTAGFSQTNKKSEKKSIEIDLTQLQIAFEDLEDFNPQTMEELVDGLRKMDDRFEFKIKYRDEDPKSRTLGRTKTETIEIDNLGEALGDVFSLFGQMVKAFEKIDIEVTDN